MEKHPLTYKIIQETARDRKTVLRRRIIDLCAPVLAGVKPAALVSFHHEHCNFNLVWNESRDTFTNQPPLSRLEFFELRQNPRETLVLFYRPIHLERILADSANRTFLTGIGYPGGNLGDTLARIRSRFQEGGPPGEGCPHEIGIFLGIPLWDVAGFIANRGRNYLFNSYWKVYHHPEQALRIFFLYDQARREVGGFCNHSAIYLQ